MQDLSEFGIAPKDITTTDDFASKAKDRIKEKARQIAGAVAAIPGTTAFDDLIGPSKYVPLITVNQTILSLRRAVLVRKITFGHSDP